MKLATLCALTTSLAVACLVGCGQPSTSPNAKRVATDPDFYAPFLISQAIRAGNLLFVSGQASLDESGAVVGEGDFDAQAAQSFENLQKVLQAGGSDLSRAVKVNIYLTDMSHFPKILELRKKYFTKPYPADTIVEVGALGLPELMIEIEAVGLIDGVIEDIEGS